MANSKRDIVILVDHARLLRLRGRFHERQRLPLAVVAGLLVAAVYVFLWGMFAGLSGLRLDFLPLIGGGFAIGTAVRLAGRGLDSRFRLLAACLALCVSVGGDLLATSVVLSPQTGGIRVTDPEQVVAFYLGGLTTWTALLYSVSAAEAAWLSVRRISPFRMTALAPRGGQRGVPVALKRGRSLSCERGHSWDPVSAPVGEDTGVATCSTCNEALYARVPASRIRAERRFDQWVWVQTIAGFALAVVLVVGGTLAGVSRWRVADVFPVGDQLVLAERSFDQGARVLVLDRVTGEVVFEAGGRDKVFEMSHQGRTVTSVTVLPDGLLMGTPNLDFDDKNTADTYLALSRVALPVPSAPATPLGKLLGGHSDLQLAGDLLTSRSRDAVAVHRFPGLEPVADLEQAAISTHAVGSGIAAGSESGRICLWTQALEGPTCADAHSSPVVALVQRPDSTWLSAGVYDGEIRAWAANLEPVERFRTDLDWQTAVAVDPTGEHLAVGGGSMRHGGEVQLWTGGERREVVRLVEDTVSALAFSEDGRTLWVGTAPPMRVSWPRLRGALYALDVESGTWEVLRE